MSKNVMIALPAATVAQLGQLVTTLGVIASAGRDASDEDAQMRDYYASLADACERYAQFLAGACMEAVVAKLSNELASEPEGTAAEEAN